MTLKITAYFPLCIFSYQVSNQLMFLLHSRMLRLQSIIEMQMQQNFPSIVRPWHALAYPFSLHLLKAISVSIAIKTRAGVEAYGAKPHSQYPRWSVNTAKRGGRQRLVVAYVSYCFSGHPTSFLISGLFRHHNRSKFHILCFALNVGDGSQERKSIVKVRQMLSFISKYETYRGLLGRVPVILKILLVSSQRNMAHECASRDKGHMKCRATAPVRVLQLWDLIPGF
jgi:predicted O-linked N-acetylglucosamine transferase (SPINDLY family)